MERDLSMIKGITRFFGEKDDDIIHHLENAWVGLYRISPYTAEYILENYNDRNRTVKKSNMERLIQDMNSDRFILNGETLIFSFDEHNDLMLTDGQHRLRACIESGKDLYSYVTFGVKSDIMGTIDTGSGRTASDALIINGIVKVYSSTHGAVARRVMALADGHNPFQPRPTPHNKILDFCTKHKSAMVRAVNITMNGRYTSAVGLVPSLDTFFVLNCIFKGHKDIHIERFIKMFGIGSDDDGNPLEPKNIIQMYRKKIPPILNKYSFVANSSRKKPRSYKFTSIYNILVACFNDWIVNPDRIRPSIGVAPSEEIYDIIPYAEEFSDKFMKQSNFKNGASKVRLRKIGKKISNGVEE